MEPRFEITFLADKGLFQEYGELHISKIRSSILYLIMGFVCLVCAGALFFQSVISPDPLDSPSFFFLFMGLFFVIYGLFYGKFLGSVMFKNGDRTFAGQPMVYRFDDGYFYALSRLQTSTIRYEAIMEVVESEKIFAMYVGQGAALLMPKDGFTLGSADQFREFIAARTGKPVRFISVKKRVYYRIAGLIAAGLIVVADVAGPILYAGYLRNAPSTLTVGNYAITVTGGFYRNEESDYDLEIYWEEGIGLLACYYSQEDMEYFCGKQNSTEEYLKEFVQTVQSVERPEYGTLPNGTTYSAHYWSDEEGNEYFYVNCLYEDGERGGYWLTEVYCLRESREQYEERFMTWANSVVVQ